MTKLGRRQLLKLGGKTAAGLAAAGTWPYGGRAEEVQPPYILTVHCPGGWDPTLVFDSKIGVASVDTQGGQRRTTGAANIPFVDHDDRPAVKTFFSNRGGKAAILNGLHADSFAYDDAVGRMFGTVPPEGQRPVDWWTFYTALLNPLLDLPHLVVDAPYMPGKHPGVAVRTTTDMITRILGDAILGKDLGSAGEKALSNFLGKSYSNLLDGVHEQSLDRRKLNALGFGYSREGRLLARLRKAAADLALPSEAGDLGFCGKLAVNLFKSGYSQCVTVQSGTRYDWNTYRDHYDRQSAAFERLFSDLESVLNYAGQQNIADNLIVVVLSERGREAKLYGNAGKGPWPVTSALVWGKGIKGGQVLGATDDYLRGLPVNPLFGTVNKQGAVPLSMSHVMSAIYLANKVPYELLLPDEDPLSVMMETSS